MFTEIKRLMEDTMFLVGVLIDGDWGVPDSSARKNSWVRVGVVKALLTLLDSIKNVSNVFNFRHH